MVETVQSGMAAMPVISALGRLRQEDGHNLKVRLGYLVGSFSPVWTTV